jgi:HD superfamily phosphohydrolase
LKRWGEIKDPLHGYIYITELEKDLIDTRPIQRLRRIKQLAGAYLTYIGAEHSRFGHVLGTMHIAGRIASHLSEKGLLDEDDVQKARVAGLLHDVGHGPFSHMFEEILDKYRHITHEDVTTWLIKESELKDVLEGHGYSAGEISLLAVGKLQQGKPCLSQIMGSQFAADIMDFLLRDSYYTGAEYGKVDAHRLIDSLDVVDDSLAMDMTASYALEAYIIARYEMFKAVYFHRSVRAAQVMIVRAMDYANECLGLTSFESPDEYLRWDDSSIISALLGLNRSEPKLRIARDFAERFIERRLLKCAYEVTIHHRDPFFTNVFSREDYRRTIASEIAEQSGVDENYVIIDVPAAPSVPMRSIQGGPAEILVFQRKAGDEKVMRKFSEVSRLVDTLTGYVDVVRVYCPADHRDKVESASESILGRRPYSTKVTY